jgi:hypothetical protein
MVLIGFTFGRVLPYDAPFLPFSKVSMSSVITGRDFVGWTGVSAITIPLEYLIGLKPAASPFDLKWHIHLTERHGVLRFPVGEANLVDLLCEARDTADEPPIITIRTRALLRLEIVYSNVHREFVVEAGETGIDLARIEHE